MTEVATPTDADPTAAPAPQPTPQPAPTSSTTPAADDDLNYVKTPREQWAPWGYRYGEAIKEANQFRELHAAGLTGNGARELMAELQKAGISPEAMLEGIRATNEPAAPQAEATNGGAPPSQPQPVTLEQVQEAINAGLLKFSEESGKQRSRAEAAQAERAAISEALKAAGHELDDKGEPKTKAGQIAKSYFLTLLNRTIEGEIPGYLTGEERAKERQRLLGEPASASALASTREAWQQDLADLKNENIASFAASQDQPNASLAAGAAGKEPQPKWEDMTEEQREQTVMEGITPNEEKF